MHSSTSFSVPFSLSVSLCLTCISVSFYILCLYVSQGLSHPVSPPPSSHVQSLGHSDSLRPHGLQHARPPCPSEPSPGAISLLPYSLSFPWFLSLSFSLCSSPLDTTPSRSEHWPSDPRTFSGSPRALTHSPLPGWAGLAGGALIPVLPAESSGQGAGCLPEGGQLQPA